MLTACARAASQVTARLAPVATSQAAAAAVLLSRTPSRHASTATPAYKLPASIRSAQPSAGGKTPHHQHSAHLPAALAQCTSAIVSHAKGSYIYSTPDQTGKQRKLLDFTTGIGVVNLGHCHPRVEAAIEAQVKKGVHLQVNCVTSQPLLQLAAKLKTILPPHLAADYQVLFSNSGAEAVENSIKLARATLKRQTVIVFQGSFHGRTIGAGSLTTAKNCYRADFQPGMPGVHVVPFPYCHRCPVAVNSKGQFSRNHCCQNPIEQLKLCLKQQTSPSEIAAILVEPVLGEGGYVVPPLDFFPQLRAIADECGCLLIADEVQSGFGRTGSVFASTQLGMVPDIVIFAKGVANGLVLSGIAAPSKIFALAKPGSIGGTFAGNAVACAAACAVIDTIHEDKVLDNVNARGAQLQQSLRDLQKRWPHQISDVRGLGLMVAIEFSDSTTAGTAGAVSKACEKRDLLVLTAGVYEALRFIPPLTISASEMTLACQTIEAAVDEVLSKQA